MHIMPHWKVILELAILWYAIYMFLLFVKGTRTEQLLKGLVVIGLIFVISQQLELHAISWMLAKLFPISVIALVVIFQPELRRALARLGQLGIHQEDIAVIDEVAKAATNLSRQKIGALIAIEREVGLKSYVESGVPIDAKVTSYLLITALIPESPLHDGALIIQRGRLVAAGCVLPLPQDDRALPKSLGMRHRAAVGLSEETDAVCIVVSEETGAISVANAGRLTRDLGEEELAKYLKNIFYKPPKEKMAFRIVKNHA